MSDSDASSDSEDFEYIPEGDDGGGRSESEDSVVGEEEEKRGVSTSTGGGGGGGGVGVSTRSLLRAQNEATSPTTRRTRRRSQMLKEDRGGGEGRGGGGGEVGENEEEEIQQKEKERVDDLWASFKQDSVASLKRPGSQQQGTKPTSSSSSSSSGNAIICSKDKAQAAEKKMVKIRKTYDFAGDEVVVEEEVAADSKEAQQGSLVASSISQEADDYSTTAGPVSEGLAHGSSRALSGSTATSSSLEVEKSVAQSLITGKKRSGISSVLQSLTKKPKMSTLEKSQLDWKEFKAKEGLEHELSQQRKDSYLDKQEFLQRTDWRQYELEREERLKKFNRHH